MAMTQSPDYEFDVLIIGSGAAGLSMALRLPGHLNCALVSKRDIAEGNTLYAQGGISAVLDSQDSVESHMADTIEAGVGLCRKSVVRTVVERGPANIRWLQEEGVAFTQTPETGDSHLHLTREGGHSHRRVIHAADATGRAIETTLLGQARAHPNITLHENHLAIDLITRAKLGGNDNRVLGAYVFNRQSGWEASLRTWSTAGSFALGDESTPLLSPPGIRNTSWH